MTDRDHIAALLRSYVSASHRHDAQAQADCFAPDAALYSSFGPPALGAAAILAAHADWVAAGERNKQMTILDLQINGDLAVCVVRYAGDYPDGEDGWATESGVSVNALRRQRDGTWKITVSSLTEDSAAPPS